MRLRVRDHDWNWGPVVDGHLLTESPLSAFAAGRASHIPLIIGTNSEESSLLGPEARAERLFPKLSKDDLAKLVALYGPQASSDSGLTGLVFRDGHFASVARWIASRVSTAGSAAYLYRFDYVLSGLQGRRTGAHHGSEIPFVFGKLPTLLQADDADVRVEHALHDCWVAFARTGKPACAEAPDWPVWGASRKWMVFDAHPSARPLENAAALDLLQCRLSEGLEKASLACAEK